MKWALGQGYSISGFYADQTARRGFYLFTKPARVLRAMPDAAASLAPRG